VLLESVLDSHPAKERAMKPIRRTMGSLIGRLFGKSQPASHVERSRTPKPLSDSHLSQVGGGVGESSASPNKGW
jgi:hypothetical protein